MWLRSGIVASVLSASALAQDFRFTVGGPAAAMDVVAKTAAFAFRIDGCAEPATPQIAGTAEGLVNGTRRSMALNVTKMSKPGVYAVFKNWPGEGNWVVSLKGTCGAAAAGAIVPLGPKGFIRESSKFFARPATDAEINESLRTLLQGGNK
jgi:hypothetical protein